MWSTSPNHWTTPLGAPTHRKVFKTTVQEDEVLKSGPSLPFFSFSPSPFSFFLSCDFYFFYAFISSSFLPYFFLPKFTFVHMPMRIKIRAIKRNVVGQLDLSTWREVYSSAFLSWRTRYFFRKFPWQGLGTQAEVSRELYMNRKSLQRAERGMCLLLFTEAER